MAASDESTALSLTLHPLVIMNVSDHFTRVRAQSTPGESASRIFGVLIGTQHGRNIEIANSFEAKVATSTAGTPKPDHENVGIRLEQYKKTFAKYDMIGWYSTGQGVQPGDLEIHQALCEMSDTSLLFLTFDSAAAVAGTSRELPITIYESEVHMVEEKLTTTFAVVPYKIDSIESERIAIDHVAHILPSGEGASGSAFAQHLGTQYTAISMLSERVDVLQRYVAAVHAGQVPADHELLRQIKSLTTRLPALDTAKFHEESLRDFNNTLLVAYLGCITKGTGMVNDIVDKYNLAHDKHSRRRGIF